MAHRTDFQVIMILTSYLIYRNIKVHTVKQRNEQRTQVWTYQRSAPMFVSYLDSVHVLLAIAPYKKR